MVYMTYADSCMVLQEVNELSAQVAALQAQLAAEQEATYEAAKVRLLAAKHKSCCDCCTRPIPFFQSCIQYTS